MNKVTPPIEYENERFILQIGEFVAQNPQFLPSIYNIMSVGLRRALDTLNEMETDMETVINTIYYKEYINDPVNFTKAFLKKWKGKTKFSWDDKDINEIANLATPTTLIKKKRKIK